MTGTTRTSAGCLKYRNDDDGGLDGDGYGYHAKCEAERWRRIAAGLCWACNEPIKPGDRVDDKAHETCIFERGHGEYVGY